jgi:hypothetical protein
MIPTPIYILFSSPFASRIKTIKNVRRSERRRCRQYVSVPTRLRSSSGPVTVLTGGRGWTSTTPGHLRTVSNFCRAHWDVTHGGPGISVLWVVRNNISDSVFFPHHWMSSGSPLEEGRYLIWGEAADERISTDLDCINNQLWVVQTVNVFWPMICTHTIYTCISVSHGSKLLQTKQRPRWINFIEEESSQVILFLLVGDLPPHHLHVFVI